MTFRRILVPVDGSGPSTKALVLALQMARERGSRVRLFHAIDELALASSMEDSGHVMSLAREQANKFLSDGLAVCQSAGVEADVKLNETPAQRLGQSVSDEAAAWEADLIVVGTHGRRGLGRVLLGSGAEQVIRMANVPVLVVRGTDD